MGAWGMSRSAQLSMRGFGHRVRGWRETWAGVERRLYSGLGSTLALASALLVLALLTYDPGDPSLNTAVDSPAANFLGRDGALVADLLIQSVGLAAYLIPAVLLGWAFRLMLQRPIRRLLRRAAMLLLALVLGASACSILHPAMRLPAGPGGAIGWTLINAVARAGFAGIALPLAMTAAAAVAWLLLAMIGLSPEDWRDIGTGAGRHAGRIARVSGRGTIAVASFGRRLFCDWREVRRVLGEDEPGLEPPPQISREEVGREEVAPVPVLAVGRHARQHLVADHGRGGEDPSLVVLGIRRLLRPAAVDVLPVKAALAGRQNPGAKCVERETAADHEQVGVGVVCGHERGRRRDDATVA